jgi:hypothetical protein
MLYAGNGRGGFLWVRQIGTGFQSRDALVATGDWDGDGKADFLARNTQNGALILYAGNGSGGFKTYRTIGSGWGGFTALLGVGDWSGDGHSDLLARTSAGHLVMYRGNGVGGFTSPFPVIGTGWNGLNLTTLRPTAPTAPVIRRKVTPNNPGNSKNCPDFSTWRAAQAWFNTYYPYYGDVAQLDRDNDHIACEALPGAP